MLMVGVTGLEPATSRTPCVRASQLRYTPTLYKQFLILHRTPWSPWVTASLAFASATPRHCTNSF